MSIYSLFNYSNMPECISALNSYYTCSKKIRDLFNSFAMSYSTEFNVNYDEAFKNIVPILSGIISYEDFCGYDENAGLCIYYPEFNGQAVPLNNSVIDANIFLPDNKDYLNQTKCSSEQVCKIDSQSNEAKCTSPQSCSDQSDCLKNEICTHDGFCMSYGYAPCMNYSDECGDEAFCYNGHCERKYIEMNTGKCYYSLCCKEGYYCIDDKCLSALPQIKLTDSIYTTLSIPLSYQPVSISDYTLSKLKDEAWISVIFSIAKTPIRTAAAFVYDNYLKTIKVKNGNNIDRTDFLNILETRLTPLIQYNDDKIKKFDSDIRKIELTGRFIISSEPDKNGVLKDQTYRYTRLNDRYDSFDEPVEAKWSAHISDHSKLNCYPSFEIDPHLISFNFVKWLYDYQFHSVIPGVFKYNQSGFTGYVKSVLFGLLGKNYTSVSDDLCVQASHALADILFEKYYHPSDSGKDLLQQVIQNNMCVDFRTVENDIMNLFNKSGEYKFSSSSCYMDPRTLYDSKTLGLGGWLNALSYTVDEIIDDNKYENICIWDIDSLNEAVPLYGLFYTSF